MKLFLAVLAFVSLAYCALPLGIYGLNTELELLRVDPSKPDATIIGPSLEQQGHLLQGSGLSAIDQRFGIYYFVAYNYTSKLTSLVSVSLTTGKVIKEYLLPFEGTGFVGVGEFLEYDPTSGEFYIMGPDALKKGNHTLLRLNIESERATVITSIASSYLSVLGGGAAFNWKSREAWFTYATKRDIFVVGINVETGKIVNNVTNDYGVTAMNYDPNSNTILGIGSASGARELISLSGGKFTPQYALRGFFAEYIPIQTINENTQMLYAFLKPTGANRTAPFDMVGVDLKTKDVKSTMYSCKIGLTCPWELESYYGKAPESAIKNNRITLQE